MTRKQRQAAKHAAGTGKGRPTPKQPPRNRTRHAQAVVDERRVQASLTGPGAAARALATIRSMGVEDRAAVEKFLRSSGGVDLAPRKTGHRS